MIYSLRSLIASPDVQTQTPEGLWVSSVPLPFYPGRFDRCRDAWAVFRQRAVAVRYPRAGELEVALHDQGWKVGR